MLKTLTETIKDELLDSVENPAVLPAVLQQYSHSKGPLYIALAQATSVITQKLATMVQQCKEQNTKLQIQQKQLVENEQKLKGLDHQAASQTSDMAALAQKVQKNSVLLQKAESLTGLGLGPSELEKLHHILTDNVPDGGTPQGTIAIFFKFVDSYSHLAEMDSAIHEKEQKLDSLEDKVQAKLAFVDQAKTLSGLGLGTKDLAKLHDLLVKLGASQGMPPPDVQKLFFSYVSKFQDAVALDIHIQQLKTASATAQAETEHWQTQAKVAETKTKARKTSIEITEKLMAQGVKEPDLPQWAKIIEKCGLPPEELAHALGQFASLEKLCQQRQERAAGFETSIQTLTAQVKALLDQREQVSAAITAVRDSALAEVEFTSQKTMENLKALMQETENYKKLQQEAAALGDFVSLAKAIREHDSGVWSQTDTATIRVLLSDVMLWCQADLSHDNTLENPTGSLAQKGTFYSWSKISMSEVLQWILKSL
jgi:hypothetical protein